MYVLETHSYWGCIKHVHYNISIKTYVLEADPYSGCIKHIRKRKGKLKGLYAKGRLKGGCIHHVKG